MKYLLIILSFTLSLCGDKKITLEDAEVKDLPMWEVKQYSDIYGDLINRYYITNKEPIYGTFSNSATTDSELKVNFIIQNNKGLI